MNTQRDPDPHGIVPDAFLDRFPEADTIREALELAERELSETDPDTMPRCPRCKSENIRTKRDRGRKQPNRRGGAMKCWSCDNHFDDPLPPVASRAGVQGSIADEGEVALDVPHCPDCHQTDRVRAYRSVEGQPQNWKCEDCNRHFNDGDEPVPEPRDIGEQATLGEASR